MKNKRRQKKKSIDISGETTLKKEQLAPEKKQNLESMHNRFMEASEKRHDAIDATVRNQQASI